MKLMIPVFINALLAILLYRLHRYPSLQKLPESVKQLAVGLLFGGVAIFSSEYGIPYEDVIINVRDASPLCAGLIFGAPAGLIAGVVGGLYRFFLGSGDYTRLACTVATILAGCIAAVLRRLMFDDRKPTWAYGVGIACVCEDLHMLLIFLLKLQDASNAFVFVQKCTVPMVIGNAAAVGLALAAVSLLSGERLRRNTKSEHISQTFQRWLLVCILVTYFVTSLFTYQLHTDMSGYQARSIVSQTLQDVYWDINDASDQHLLEITQEIKAEYQRQKNWDSAALAALARRHDVAEINVIAPDGIVVQSSAPEIVGYDMASGNQSREFLCLFTVEQQYVQRYQPMAIDPTVSRKYAAVRLPDGRALQAGYGYEQFKRDIDTYLSTMTKNRHIGKNGFVIIGNEDGEIVAGARSYVGETLEGIGIHIDPATMQKDTLYTADIGGKPYRFAYLVTEGYYLIGTIPETEAAYMRDAALYVSILVQVLIFACLFVLVYFLIKRVIINNLRRINGSLAQITGGNLNVKVDVRSNAEFASLSDDINSTVATLKRYIAEAAARIDKELEYAKQIQLSALPAAIPDNERFHVCACMNAAKEVGGDFYDFYTLNDDKVAFLVADVSGKGIPAAMFMMTAKAVLKDLAESGSTVDEVFTRANEKLCSSNESGMFVTAWMGVLELDTGKLTYVNAGHNPPLLLHDGEEFQYLKSKPSFVLAGMEGIRYRLQELTLTPGDRIFLYTDGVTEAMDSAQQLYGTERLLQYMKQHAAAEPQALLDGLQAELDRFVDGGEQFDDITMLVLDYHRKKGRCAHG